jgi:DNA mismatch repair protein MutL
MQIGGALTLPIRVLSPQEAARIAAGEVIERPASVVKELVENSLDAGARQVTVELRGGGLAFIRIIDDGGGIAPEELRIAFERHATSKVQSENELWRIATLGFRGEALPSIAAAADVTLVSRPPGALVAGRIIVRGGEIDRQGSSGAPPGTSVTVERLFARQPARLKFMRSPSSEGAQVATAVTHYALAYPEVRFTLRSDNKTLLQTPGNGDLRDAVAAAYGVSLASELLPLDIDESQHIDVRGLAGSPAVSRANRNYISLFVNRRWIRNRALTFAVEEAYQGMMPSGRHPVAVIEIRLPPDEVDVNVHPTKAEVRFRDERAAFGAVQRAVRRVLSTRAPVPSLDAGVWTHSESVEVRGSTFHRGPGAASPNGEGASSAVIWREQPANLPLPTLVPATSNQQPATSPLPANSDQGLATTLPMLRPVGQLGNLYIIAEGPEGMYLIDQHAAHERVLYERFLARQRDGVRDVQPLLQPQPVDLTARQRSMLDTFSGDLSLAGLDVEPFGGDGAFIVRAVPPSLAGSDVSRAVGELLDLLGREDAPREEPGHRVAASLACHAAVRAGKAMSEEEQRELLNLLEASEHPRTCPHGRPTMVHLSSETIAKQFGRR